MPKFKQVLRKTLNFLLFLTKLWINGAFIIVSFGALWCLVTGRSVDWGTTRDIMLLLVGVIALDVEALLKLIAKELSIIRIRLGHIDSWIKKEW